MATQQDLDRRIKAVSNTRKITRAMEMIAAAKLRKAQQAIETLRPFADAIVDLTARVVNGIQAGANVPLLEKREAKKVCIVMFTGDRGLAGALNANVLRRSLALSKQWQAEGAEVRWLGVGKKGVASLQFRNLTVDNAWRGITDSPKFRDAEAIGKYIIQHFEAAEYDRVQLVYNSFESAMSQKVLVQDLLPLTDELMGVSISKLAQMQAEVEALPVDSEFRIKGGFGGAMQREKRDDEKTAQFEPDWFFEPESEELLARLLPTYIEQAIYRALLESTASEHGARMSAMRNATENAGEMIDNLTLQRNRARQAAITQEILEVVGGADALG
jgi:F-type H+-transporting ATPase subunit gamma